MTAKGRASRARRQDIRDYPHEFTLEALQARWREHCAVIQWSVDQDVERADHRVQIALALPSPLREVMLAATLRDLMAGVPQPPGEVPSATPQDPEEQRTRVPEHHGGQDAC